jgi:hypothetical protein
MAIFRPGSRRSGRGLLSMALAVGLIAALLVWASPGQGWIGFSPLLLILLLCPLIHMFMHRGHGSRGSGEAGPDGGVHRQ